MKFYPIIAVWLVLWFGITSHAFGASWLNRYSSIVLVSGLAGDLESESEYQGQLNSWLELLTAQSFKGGVYVLSDVPVEKQTSGLNLVTNKATRDTFLALKPESSSNSPALIVVWGHGGTQGSKPVFHVRGPRLMAADFTEFSNKLPGCDWILFFRGSGSFARALSVPGCRILSSEADTAYTSDPIGMQVLLRGLASGETEDFRSLAQSLGNDVMQWYESRHLARSEQPAFWTGTGEAKLLAAGEPPLTASVTNTATTLTTNLSPVWKDIHAIDPLLFPGEDAVVLSRNVTCTLAERPALSMEVEEFIQILTVEGKHFADFDYQYAPPEQDIRFFDCEVLKSDGALIRLDAEAIRDVTSGDGGGSGWHRKIFSLPQVGPGAILHVRMQTVWQSYPMPHVSTQIPLDAEVPILKEKVKASVPKGDTFHIALENTGAQDPEVKLTEYGTSYLWKFENVNARSREVLSLPGAEPRLMLSTFSDWTEFTAWYGRISKLADEITPAITSKAREITRDAKTDEEKIEAVFRYVTNLRYVAVEMGINSFRPHAADHVLQNQYGDCKDKANLFITLLRSLGIEGMTADLVLVPRFTQASEQTPGLAFNHAIARVVLRGVTNWVDTTDDVCRFGMLPPGDPGRQVLVIDGQTKTLTALPNPMPRDHWLVIHSVIKPGDLEKGDLVMEVEVKAAGFADYELRSKAREIKKHAMNAPLLASILKLTGGAFSLKKQSISDVAALHDDFTSKMEGEILGAVELTGEDQITLRAPFWLPREWDAALHQRSTPLFINQGYPLKLDETIEFDLSEMTGASKAMLENKSGSLSWKLQSWTDSQPSGQLADIQGPLSWKLEWMQEGSKVIARLQLELATGEVIHFDSFQKQLRQLQKTIAVSLARVTLTQSKTVSP